MLVLVCISGNFFNVSNHAMLTVARIFPIKHLNEAMLIAFNPHTSGSGITWSDLAIIAALGHRRAPAQHPLLPPDTRFQLAKEQAAMRDAGGACFVGALGLLAEGPVAFLGPWHLPVSSLTHQYLSRKPRRPTRSCR